MNSTKLLTIFVILFLVNNGLNAQCSLITKNGSFQDPKTVCAPVDFTMNVWYKFLIPVDTTKVIIRFVWNDGFGATTTVKGKWNAKGDSVWAEASHIYPPDNECSKTCDAYLIFDGDICTSSGHQEQTFSTWGTDEENSGVLSTDPVVAYFCEGENIVNVTFRDNSSFNCNIGIEPDNPNRYFRWVQFVYNTYSQTRPRIPNVTVVDGGGTTHIMTDGSGSFVSSLSGPIIQIPIPADGPNQTSFQISAPAGGLAGDIFEITLRNWNVCNPYDDLPTDGLPPSDLIDGDNPPITTTARIEIIAPPPVVVSSLFEFCTGNNITLTASAGAATVKWYSDSLLTNLLYTGNNFQPQNPPTLLNNLISGTYTFWVSSFQGVCESAPSKVVLKVYQNPSGINAGTDQYLCADSTQMNASSALVGSGKWSTPGSAIISNISDPNTKIDQLAQGSNLFIWTVTNGPCYSSDTVIIYSDRQPSPANAGSDGNICGAGVILLNATSPNLSSNGHWLVIQGSGTLSDTTLPNAQLLNPSMGNNRLLWRVSSQYGVCPVTTDTVEYFIDLSPGTAFAGFSSQLCGITSVNLTATPAVNGGIGAWSTLTGSNLISDIHNASATVSNLTVGVNQYVWTLTSQFGLCPSTADTVTYINDLSPGIANAGTDRSYCLENTDTLDGNAPIIGTGNWNVITNPSATLPVFLPSSTVPQAIFKILPGNEGNYVLGWTLKNGSCVSIDTVSLNFGIPPPPANAGNDSSVCGQVVRLNGNSFGLGMGTWTKISGPGMVTFNPGIHAANAVISISAGMEGTYTFEWRLASGSCPSTADTVSISFKPYAPVPVTMGDESCGPDSLLLSGNTSALNNIVLWFQNAADIIPVYTGTNYETPLLLLSRNYYVAGKDTLSGCESPRIAVVANIFPIPSKPLLTGDTLCGPGMAIVNGKYLYPANTIKWFDDAGLTSSLGTGNNLSVLASLNRHVWATAIDTIHGCVSSADSAYILVHPAIPAPIGISDTTCGASDFMLTTFKSDTNHYVRWYTAPTGGSIIHIADSMYLPVNDSSQSFWIEEWNASTGCVSSRSKITAWINPIPGNPVINDTGSCGAASFTLKPDAANFASTYRWYSLPIGGSILKEADSLTTGLLSSNQTYWVAGYNQISHCEGNRKKVDVTIFPLPSPITIMGPTLVLKNQTGVIFATTGSSTSNYTWSIPSGIVINQNMNDFVRLGFPNTGSFDISVYEVTSNGCPGTTTFHPVTVINDSIAVDIGTYNQVACTNVDFEIKPYLFGGTPPYTYQWTGDAGYLSTTTSLFTTFSPPGKGTFYLKLKVVDVNLKSSTDSVKITVYDSPTANITDQNAIVCVGDQYNMNVQTTGYSAVAHLWSGPVQNLSSYTIIDPVYSPHQPDTVKYKYQLTDLHGCKAYDSIEIYSDIPVAYFQILTPPACSPLEIQFDNQSLRAIKSIWDFGDGTGTSVNSPAHLYVNQSPEIKYYPVKLSVTSILGCTAEFTQYAMVWPNPVASLDAIPDKICSPATIQLFSTPGNMRYYWDFGDGDKLTTTSFSTNHNFKTTSENDTIYTAKVITQSSLNCVDTALLKIEVYAAPEPDFVVFPPYDTFPRKSFELKNLTEGNRWNYKWTLGDGRSLLVKEPGKIDYEAPGNYSVTLKASTNHCSDSVSKTIYLFPAPPIAKFAGIEPGCMPHTINFINNSEYADSYLWEFGDGSISTAREPDYTYYQAGIYRIKLTVRGDGGEASFSDTARVYVLPNSFFDLAPRYVYVNDEAVNFFNLSENADIIEWDFGDGNTSKDLNPKHQYKQEGKYDITLKVWTINNCFDLYIMENAVFVEPSGVVEFPNAFRPDSPLEENRVFKPGVIDHVDNYHLMIFNRWGELIFESFDQETGWDGNYKGELAKPDVYIWKVKGTYTDGRGFAKTGDVTLMQ